MKMSDNKCRIISSYQENLSSFHIYIEITIKAWVTAWTHLYYATFQVWYLDTGICHKNFLVAPKDYGLSLSCMMSLVGVGPLEHIILL